MNIHPSNLGNLQWCPKYTSDGEDSPASQRGTLLHELVADAKRALPEDLTEEEVVAVNACREHLKGILNTKWADVAFQLEVSLQTRLPIPGRPLEDINLRGKLDVLMVEGDRYATVIDWKFGRFEPPAAKDNVQMMAYAYLVFRNKPSIAAVTCRLVCPLIGESAIVTEHVWDRSFFEYMQTILSDIVIRYLDPGAKPHLNPSICRYCASANRCPEMTQVIFRGNETYTPERVIEALSSKVMTPVDRGLCQRAAEWAENWAKQVKRANLEAVLTDDAEIEGYALTRRRGSVKVTNTPVAVVTLKERGYPEDLVINSCTLSLTALTQALAATGEKGGREAVRKELEENLQAVLQEGEPVVYLRQKRGKNE